MLEPPDRAFIDDLADKIAICAAHIDSAQHQLLTHIRSFDAAPSRSMNVPLSDPESRTRTPPISSHTWQ